MSIRATEGGGPPWGTTGLPEPEPKRRNVRLIVLLGGLGNPWGVALAASIVLVLPEKLQALQEYRFLLYAVLVILVLLVRPEGLVPRRAREYFSR